MTNDDEMTECLYCGSFGHTDSVPAVNDDAAWQLLKTEHTDGCEWLATRAHRVRAGSNPTITNIASSRL